MVGRRSLAATPNTRPNAGGKPSTPNAQIGRAVLEQHYATLQEPGALPGRTGAALTEDLDEIELSLSAVFRGSSWGPRFTD
jgi:hypothetical protein